MEDRMSHYRGYFLRGDHIVAPENIDAADDAGAMLKASELLSTSQFSRMEVWHETRLVGALSATTQFPAYAANNDPHSSEGGMSNIQGLRRR